MSNAEPAFQRARRAEHKQQRYDSILIAARKLGLRDGVRAVSLTDIAAEVGIKAPSIYHHFPTKADLGAAVAKRYWEDIVVDLEAISDQSPDPIIALHRYPEIFRKSLSSDNRMCLCSFMAAEYDDLPEAVKTEVQAFVDVNVAWLSKLLSAAGIVKSKESQARARAIYSAVAGAQLLARGRSDISLFDAMIDSYRSAGLLPA